MFSKNTTRSGVECISHDPSALQQQNTIKKRVLLCFGDFLVITVTASIVVRTLRNMRRVMIEFHSRTFHPLNQLKQRLRSKQRCKIVMKSLPIKTRYQNLLPGCGFLCLTR